MKALSRAVIILLSLVLASGGLVFLPLGSRTTAHPELGRWRLAWSDEFEGVNGSRPDSSKWKFEVGGNGWGNHELEYYTDRPENSRVDQGMLVIEARREHYTGQDGVRRLYTSARLTTRGTFSQAYGRFTARIKLPRGQGMWPAFWLLGVDFDKLPWPDCGEIDIMENIGKEPASVHGSMHGPGYSRVLGFTSTYKLPGGPKFSDDFHIFSIEWEPKVVRFYTDEYLYATFVPAQLPSGMRWVFDHPFYIILNLAVGGDWPGPPDSTTNFPQQMLVDYVRVYNAAPETGDATRAPSSDTLSYRKLEYRPRRYR